ncbi:hypothetical protein DFP72DRAFT_839454 [Ephemerocybe angulata]|uniref:Uncharacterized protein n=1 Tax=Ephemerocybe angulata TaxID=980116 RepID=A0A8H6IHM9_9AGAR|nr:hypothetical protein DFP72DRAFT_839454 [Tulosesus angulatus]
MGERYESGSAVRLESVTSHVGVPFAAKGKRGRRGRQAEGTNQECDYLLHGRGGRPFSVRKRYHRTPGVVHSAAHHPVRSSGQKLNEKRRGDAKETGVKVMGEKLKAKLDSGQRGGHIWG